MFHKAFIRTIVSALVLCLTLSSCTSKPALEVLHHSITVREFTADRSQSTATVTGIARNSSKSKINECCITVTFYDCQGTALATETAVKEQMAPAEVWDFKVVLKGEEAWEVARYTLSATNR